MAKLVVNVPEKSDLYDFLSLIQEQIEMGYTSGHIDVSHDWELTND